MTEENDDDIWADDFTEAERPQEEDNWERNDDFFNEYNEGNTWVDSQGFEHELFTGELPDDAEHRVHYDTFGEAVDYINEILTGADQFFDIIETDDGYEVYYMGGSE